MEISNGVHQQHDWWNFAENDWLPSKMNEKYNQLFNAQWYRRYHSRNKTFEHLLQPQRLLERSCGHPKARQSEQCFWKSGSWLAAETSAVASLSASLSPHSSAQVRRSHAKQSSPSRLTFFAWRHSGPRAGRKTYNYTLAVVDSASHHIKAEPSTSKEATEIAGTFRRILHSWTAEVARIFASRPEGRVHGRCHQTYESKWDNHSSRTRGYSQRSGNRWKIQSHPYWAPIRVPICCWNAAAQGSKIFRMGSRLPAVVSALNNEVTDWLIGKKLAEAIKEKAVAGKLAKLAKQTCQCRFLRFIALKQVGSARFCLPEPHKS